MATSFEETTLRRLPLTRSRAIARRRSRSRLQRLTFTGALLVFAFATFYSSVALFARVYPAIFPGQTLGDVFGVNAIVPPLPGLAAINRPDLTSPFNDNITLLVMGVDKRPQDAEEGNLTDVVMIATMDPIGKTVNFLSFPRDMEIKIHTDKFTYEDRINTSYGVGFRTVPQTSDLGAKQKEGAKQLQRDMKENFGLETDGWVVLDFKGVEKLIDSVGGVDLVIPYELSVGNWFYSDDDVHGQYLSFPPGAIHVDGYHAVAFGRNRNDSDFYRIKRQQLVLQAAIQKVFAQGLLSQDPFDLWNTYSGTVRTNMSPTRLAGLLPLLRQTQARSKMYSVADPVNGVQTLEGITTNGGASVQLWNPENVKYWLTQVFTKAAYAASAVEIENGYGVDGTIRAEALGVYLKYSKSLPTVSTGPDKPVQLNTTVTLYGEKRQLAEDIAKWLGISATNIIALPRPADSTLPDVVIVIGKDFKLPGQ